MPVLHIMMLISASSNKNKIVLTSLKQFYFCFIAVMHMPVLVCTSESLNRGVCDVEGSFVMVVLVIA